MSLDVNILKSFKIFSDLGTDQLYRIIKYFDERKIDRGEVFLTQGQATDNTFLIVSGFVKMYDVSADGQELIVDILKNGDIANILSTFANRDQFANAVAMTPVKVLVIKKKDLKLILKTNPDTVLNAMGSLADMCIEKINLVHDLSFRLVIHRLSKILISILEDENDWPHLTQYEMAAMIGTSRKAVNRALKDLEDKNAIVIGRKGISITDKELLHTIIYEKGHMSARLF